ncbi:MAG: hypothetical protein EOO77_05390 [Oxalobacteraceae bacterium]|nr:MAG: hypothetical protein EOO77_05390 [Oxalobacteraceae bacterium]
MARMASPLREEELTTNYTAGAVSGIVTADYSVSNVPAVTIAVSFSAQVSASSGRLNGSPSIAGGGSGRFAGDLPSQQVWSSALRLS